MTRPAMVVLCASAAALALACGQKGPPLAPLHLVPASPTGASVTRVGSEARVRFVIPSTNLNGPGTPDIDRMEIFGATVAAGAAEPPNREFLSAKYRIGTIPVKPPPVEGEAPPAGAPPDTRPAAGEKAAFVEKLTAETMTPVFTTPAPKPVAPAPSTAATKELTPPPTYAVRIYSVRGVTRSGRPGQPSARLQLPLVDPPAPAVDFTATAGETAIALAWKAAAAAEKPLTFNIYKVGGTDPINTEPVTAPQYERPGVEFGTEECFVVRVVEKVGDAELESESSEPACVTPLDTYAPNAPQRLTAVAAPGVISLSWDANTEKDLAGYVVLRGEAPGDTLQPLTPAPITATAFEDKTVKPGVRYVYAIVAVDKATPPNRSAQSARVEETAR